MGAWMAPDTTCIGSTWVRRQVQVGLDSANAGRLVAAEDVEAEFATRRDETRRKLQPKS